MIEWAVLFGAFSSTVAWLGLVIKRMVLKFLPPVAVLTVHLVGAAAFIIAENLSLRPIRTLDSVVFVLIRVSSEILGVVSIDTLVSVMFIDVGAEDGFVFVEVEELILFQVVEEIDLDFRFIVSK